jgi:predicted esterase YcpF (UPF0227 family)
MAQVNQEILKEINELKAEMVKVQNALGEIALIKAQEGDLVASYRAAQEKLQQASDKLMEEHGPGTLDTNTGEFTPQENEAMAE